MVRDRTTRDLSVTLFNRKLTSPIYVAPVGVLGAVHPDCDLETAKGATRVGVPIVCSTLSACRMEETRAASKGNMALFQLYPPADAELSEHFVSRAIEAGFDGIVITVDTGQLGWRPHDLQKASLPMHYGQCLANYTSDPAFWRLAGVNSEAELTIDKKIATWDKYFSDPGFTWGLQDFQPVFRGAFYFLRTEHALHRTQKYVQVAFSSKAETSTIDDGDSLRVNSRWNVFRVHQVSFPGPLLPVRTVDNRSTSYLSFQSAHLLPPKYPRTICTKVGSDSIQFRDAAVSIVDKWISGISATISGGVPLAVEMRLRGCYEYFLSRLRLESRFLRSTNPICG